MMKPIGSNEYAKQACKAFTLIEMTVVITIIALLAAVVLRTIALVSRSGDEARTLAHIQRVSNAVEGFHAEYGQYPPVPLYPSGAFLGGSDRYYCRYCGHDQGTSNPGTESCRRPGCNENTYTTDFQPFGYEFPPDVLSRRIYDSDGDLIATYNANTFLVGVEAIEWNAIPIFTFGLMSFLLPRPDSSFEERDLTGFYDSPQWRAHNTSEALSARDAAAIQKWIFNLVDDPPDDIRTLLTIDTSDLSPLSGRPDSGPSPPWFRVSGNQYIPTRYLTMRDAWRQELHYKSSPPFQTYRIWAVAPGTGRILESARWDD